MSTRVAGRRRRRLISRPALVAALREHVRRGRAPNYAALRRAGRMDLGWAAWNHFGSAAAGFAAAGIVPRPLMRPWNRDRVLAAIRARAAEAKSLRYARVYEEDAGLACAGSR